MWTNDEHYISASRMLEESFTFATLAVPNRGSSGNATILSRSGV